MHVAIIPDGNRRYAKKNMLARIFGHKHGVNVLIRVLKLAPKYGIDIITVYALSTENLAKRSPEEVDDLYEVLKEAFKKYKDELIGANVRARIIGNLASLPKKFVQIVEILQEETKQCTGQLLQICLGYGGRDEISRAVNKALEAGEQRITEEIISKYLDSPLEPDLIVRTGGDHRLSNFLLWQGSYSELYFTDTLWPEFNEKDLQQALAAYRPDRVNKGK